MVKNVVLWSRFGATTLIIMTFSISITACSIASLNIMIFSITTYSITVLKTQHS